MLISVVVPVYQAKDSLERCVHSVVKEHSDEIEIILVDDGSIDGSSEICDRLTKEYKQVCVYHQTNQGVAAARNQGIKLARGEYVMFLDADDEFVSKSLKTIISYAKKNIDFVAFSYYSWFPDGKLVKESFPGKAVIQDYDIFMKILLGTPLLHTCWGKLFRKSLIEENQIHFPIGMPIGEDYVFVMEYCNYIQTQILVNEYVLKYYQNPSGAMGNFQLQKQLDCLEYVWNYCKSYVSSKNRKKYYEDMCLYEFLKIASIIRMLVEKTRGKRTYYALKKMVNAPIVREIVEAAPVKKLCLYRKIEYLFIRWKLVFIVYSYFNIKAQLKRIEQIIR